MGLRAPLLGCEPTIGIDATLLRLPPTPAQVFSIFLRLNLMVKATVTRTELSWLQSQAV